MRTPSSVTNSPCFSEDGPGRCSDRRTECSGSGCAAERWEITFTDVPVGAEQRIRISDPNTCALNATGASTEGVSANGTLLTRIVDTPGSGIEPGLAFQASADGTVTP